MEAKLQVYDYRNFAGKALIGKVTYTCEAIHDASRQRVSASLHLLYKGKFAGQLDVVLSWGIDTDAFHLEKELFWEKIQKEAAFSNLYFREEGKEDVKKMEVSSKILFSDESSWPWVGALPL